jgi:prolyl-tRNA editing enzyme YbaK/EbsC (Cys-tRNA(Pro) deacylase)
LTTNQNSNIGPNCQQIRYNIEMNTLHFQPAVEHPELVTGSVFKQLSPDIQVAEIDPQYMNGLALFKQYGGSPEDGANCVIVRGKRGTEIIMAAVVIPVGYRADLNGIVSEKLNARKVSMAPLEEVLAQTGMEYGSITPIGLPESYKIFIDSRLMEKKNIIVGGGKQISKLLVPTAFFKTLPNVDVIEGLANPA